MTTYAKFFCSAQGSAFAPYGYQTRLAEQPWVDLVDIPTGLGKTDAVVLAWLFKRYQRDVATPRRLVYCLPMRTLVEQTVNKAKKWVQALIGAGYYQETKPPEVVTLMGGQCDHDWDIDPVQEQIIVGTQDQLLSRALNRGYGMSRFRWPVDFGLINNDCLWVLDEVQLMGAG